MILILSNKWDVSVDFVVRELQKKNHPYIRVNTEDLIDKEATISLPDFYICFANNETYNIAKDVRVIWYRRPGKPFDDIPEKDRPSLAIQKYINDQWYSWLEALQVIPNITWINKPYKNDLMENKIHQLFLATKLGFRIPQTIVSNDPDSIKNHVNKLGGRVVAKSLYSPLLEEPHQDYFIFSNEITLNKLGNPDQLKMAPTIYQQLLLPKNDYRVTVIENEVLAAKITTKNGCAADLDWRTQKEGLSFSSTILPDKIERLCRQYVSGCGLTFGAIDLVEYNSNFYFLEINPNGEWGWLQKPHKLPIAKTLADYMILKDDS